MKEINLKLFLKKFIFFFVGLWIIQLGVALFLGANIGSDPFTVFTQGLSKVVGVTPGQSNMIITGVLFVILAIIDRTYINIGTFLSVLLAGQFIDLSVKMVSVIPFKDLGLIVNCLVLVVGCIIIGIGFSILKASNLGVAPNDVLVLMLVDKTKVEYRWVRMTYDVLVFVVGFFLGGVVGVGTIIVAGLTGPCIQFFMPKLEKVVKAILKEETETGLKKSA
ncbi:YczE/YyaS/YitT family protein [Inconstantimicrobium mannanitabidum]|uniref:Uncharacterized protein n=1 Tax=Inconstantimicrobium mannanitabidum TaxID=1604901 RepID=A0ACB5R6Z6_9CLOT|nr:hypothetical protein [Clostridium sp. TW13]GKX64965.1 hypothetical protein rsdtw13_02230 [Clostridium sp. TW13]